MDHHQGPTSPDDRDDDLDDMPSLVDAPVVLAQAQSFNYTFSASDMNPVNTSSGGNSSSNATWLSLTSGPSPAPSPISPSTPSFSTSPHREALPSEMAFSIASPAPETHIPRPPNAFILFRSSFIQSQKLLSTTEGNHGVLSKIIGAYWRALPPSERRKWEIEADKARERHRQKHTGWRFLPGNASTDAGRGVSAGAEKAKRARGRIKDRDKDKDKDKDKGKVRGSLGKGKGKAEEVDDADADGEDDAPYIPRSPPKPKSKGKGKATAAVKLKSPRKRGPKPKSPPSTSTSRRDSQNDTSARVDARIQKITALLVEGRDAEEIEREMQMWDEQQDGHGHFPSTSENLSITTTPASVSVASTSTMPVMATPLETDTASTPSTSSGSVSWIGRPRAKRVLSYDPYDGDAYATAYLSPSASASPHDLSPTCQSLEPGRVGSDADATYDPRRDSDSDCEEGNSQGTVRGPGIGSPVSVPLLQLSGPASTATSARSSPQDWTSGMPMPVGSSLTPLTHMYRRNRSLSTPSVPVLAPVPISPINLGGGAANFGQVFDTRTGSYQHPHAQDEEFRRPMKRARYGGHARTQSLSTGISTRPEIGLTMRPPSPMRALLASPITMSSPMHTPSPSSSSRHFYNHHQVSDSDLLDSPVGLGGSEAGAAWWAPTADDWHGQPSSSSHAVESSHSPQGLAHQSSFSSLSGWAGFGSGSLSGSSSFGSISSPTFSVPPASTFGTPMEHVNQGLGHGHGYLIPDPHLTSAPGEGTLLPMSHGLVQDFEEEAGFPSHLGGYGEDKNKEEVWARLPGWENAIQPLGLGGGSGGVV